MKDTIKAPERIYLQVCGDCNINDRETCEQCCKDNPIGVGREVTWCVDKVFDNDVTYIRADKVYNHCLKVDMKKFYNPVKLTKDEVLTVIYNLEDMISSLESDVHVSGKIISILTQVTQLIARIDTESLSDEQIMRVLNAIGYEERSWIEHVRKHMAISE